MTPEEELQARRDNTEWWERFWARREAIQRASRRSAGVIDDTE